MATTTVPASTASALLLDGIPSLVWAPPTTPSSRLLLSAPLEREHKWIDIDRLHIKLMSLCVCFLFQFFLCVLLSFERTHVKT
eukprot:m.20043 g.20043  ORF g.20043 m.20043 type:complete len:83 (-) comp8537_c0_seq1:31-279(-)